ncbi:WXG100 family type VII secretion target [Nocardia sp. CDC159]|uniref:WXG100 family type VII secretion target n=1 Tax=Nocardia pulmonis TaxID=2951408 RepID=A0A9X2J0K9_9NOCA|nr:MULTISPECIES: WXG100 family type VII secretion target [Nocardia]MCM6776051.1 WXG100 family type VII secretion target [Nocardia pulmonis]MCM6788622.1 WXG100 family type VII secretion target [Nocardia sp. CDC159]
MSAGGGPSGSEANLSVVPEDVQAVGRYVYEIADTMRQALDSAAREVDTLLTSEWTGDAAEEFRTGWDETRDGGTQLMQALTGLAEKLGITAANYRSTDADNAAGFSSLNLPS